MSSDATSNVLFISHNAADRPFAEALERAIHALLDSKTLIDVKYSTGEHGPEGGETWRSWIYRQVVEARTILVVVTPHALGKPWLLWEVGACWGAGLAEQAVRGANLNPGQSTRSGVAGDRLIISIAYGLPTSECPDPLRGEQIVVGNDVRVMEQQFRRVFEAHAVPNDVIYEAGKRTERVMQQYRAEVERAMTRAPSLVNEANVQDWLVRLKALADDDRLSELGGFERWMMLAFGRDTDEDTRTGGIPIDVRLHRQLGELHLSQKQYPQAARQLRLAWRAAPRDIFVLRPLATATMNWLLSSGAQGATDQMHQDVRTILEEIKRLDPAYIASPDAAGLAGKYYRRVLKDLDRALMAYQEGLDANPNSYYLAGLVAQTELELGRRDAAQATFRRALEILDRLGENNIWSHASAATAHVGLNRLDSAREHLERLRAIKEPTESEADTIATGIREVGERIGIAPDALDALLLALDPRQAVGAG